MTAAPRPREPHPALDTLADLDAGVLEGADAERVAAHVGGCARCGQVMAALDGVRADLRTLPAPPIPATVVTRLDAVLADLRTAPDTTAPDPTAPDPTAPDRAADRTAPVTAAAKATASRVVDLDAVRERRGRRLTTAIGAAAAAVALVVAGAAVTSLVRAGGAGGDSSAAGGGGGATYQEESARQKGDVTAVPAPASPPLPSYDRTTLRAVLPTLAKAYPLSTAVQSGPDGPAGPMADAALRTACARSIPGVSEDPRAVLRVRYGGQPAYVFVFVDGAGVPTAYVVGDQCGRAAAVPATVLDAVR
jgi:hypothetical protein